MASWAPSQLDPCLSSLGTQEVSGLCYFLTLSAKPCIFWSWKNRLEPSGCIS